MHCCPITEDIRDPYASHVLHWLRAHFLWDYLDSIVRCCDWPRDPELAEALTVADENLQRLGGSVDAAERRWGRLR